MGSSPNDKEQFGLAKSCLSLSSNMVFFEHEVRTIPAPYYQVFSLSDGSCDHNMAPTTEIIKEFIFESHPLFVDLLSFVPCSYQYLMVLIETPEKVDSSGKVISGAKAYQATLCSSFLCQSQGRK